MAEALRTDFIKIWVAEGQTTETQRAIYEVQDGLIRTVWFLKDRP